MSIGYCGGEQLPKYIQTAPTIVDYHLLSQWAGNSLRNESRHKVAAATHFGGQHADRPAWVALRKRASAIQEHRRNKTMREYRFHGENLAHVKRFSMSMWQC